MSLHDLLIPLVDDGLGNSAACASRTPPKPTCKPTSSPVSGNCRQTTAPDPGLRGR
jgi:hypothetical protein